LRPRLPREGTVLEIAAGAGEHTIYNAAAFPGLQWQPTDLGPDCLASIAAWRDHAALANVLPPLQLDASHPAAWPIHRADAIININMIHISPWAATQGLMAGAGRLLPSRGIIFLYGPFIEADVETAPSNVAFDRSLKTCNPDWGIRRLEEVTDLATGHGLELTDRITMPANNISLFFRKR
jgi:hypothetical protein